MKSIDESRISKSGRQIFILFTIALIASTIAIVFIQSPVVGAIVNAIVLIAVAVLVSVGVKHLTLEVGRLSGDQKKKDTELDIARNIQMQNLPSAFPAFPDRNDFDIYAVMEPFKDVGGDFYDYFLIDDDHLAMVIADVSDKGIPAALYMMMAKTRIADIARSEKIKSPGEILKKANNYLSENNDSVMFVTVWMGILTLSTGDLVSANGGHPDPFICTDGSFKMIPEKHSMILGAFENTEYVDNKIKLNRGDTIFVCTDGLIEAVDENEKQFGTDRILEALNAHKDGSISRILVEVKNAVDEFSGTDGIFDDITMMALRLL